MDLHYSMICKNLSLFEIASSRAFKYKLQFKKHEKKFKEETLIDMIQVMYLSGFEIIKTTHTGRDEQN